MAKDIYHNSVKEALSKDEWIITHDPYIIRLGGRDSVEADCGICFELPEPIIIISST
ncbi:element excision factor XisH family protein [Haliscomenobacter sp.]|uniref:element excision factor XisH family protein n=1 Tax=Haliscomenobacter sp. TaxID=2717303 RepID=UPI0039B6EAB2